MVERQKQHSGHTTDFGLSLSAVVLEHECITDRKVLRGAPPGVSLYYCIPSNISEDMASSAPVALTSSMITEIRDQTTEPVSQLFSATLVSKPRGTSVF